MDKAFFTETRQRWLLLLLTAFTFFILLGSRALNEPDEGRYSEIAREMIETGNWVVPHFWYLPHLDKPPLTYWLVAISMKLFGQNEWAARLPLALAGMSGVWAVWLLGSSIGGRRVGFWSALMLQTSLLYFVMARMLTTDMFLTQFTAWAVYFLWRSWQSLTSDLGLRTSDFWLWHLAGWTAIALGFLTKGPVALVIPLVALAALVVYRWKSFAAKKLLLGGLTAGLALFLVLVLPWFLAVFRRVPESFDYMTVSQAAGHLLGTTIKNRKGGPFYFFGILAVGLLPWTFLLGWLWRRIQPAPTADVGMRVPVVLQKDAWVLLNVWVIFTFTLFSFSQAKLPAYILPVFPALAVMLAWRFFGDERTTRPAPALAWRFCLGSSLLVAGGLPAGRGLCLPPPAAGMDEMADAGHGRNHAFGPLAGAKMETVAMRRPDRGPGRVGAGGDAGRNPLVPGQSQAQFDAKTAGSGPAGKMSARRCSGVLGRFAGRAGVLRLSGD